MGFQPIVSGLGRVDPGELRLPYSDQVFWRSKCKGHTCWLRQQHWRFSCKRRSRWHKGAPAAGGTAAPAATTTAPAATTTAPAATNDTSSQPTDSKKSASKRPAKKKMTRQQEIDHSVDSGTVPARYRSSVPKQYQQYVPFDKQ